MNPQRQDTALPRVLIVDDEPSNVMSLAEAIADLCDVRVATRAAEVAALASALRPDLILLDLHMPDGSGFEVLAQLREDAACRDIPVIIVTASAAAGDEEAGLGAGAVDFISKPIRPAIVRARVRTHAELKRRRDQLAELAQTDFLTGIANRRRFDLELAQRWRAAARHEAALGLVLADVDHFKQYNDHFGHGPGDECLRAVARALSDCAGRADDLAARFGGEEFALLYRPGDGGALLARVLGAVEALALPHPASSAGPHVSISLGAVELRPGPGDDAGGLLRAADELLYRAKREGRARGLLRRLGSTTDTTIRLGE